MLFELRRYETEPGTRDRLVEVMEADVIPFQTSKGVVILGSFVAEEDPNVYVWLRRFEDEEHRKALYAAVYDSDFWKNEIAPKLKGVIVRETIQVTRLTPTALSPIR
jgi:quinol monooxygenase YgiN